MDRVVHVHLRAITPADPLPDAPSPLAVYRDWALPPAFAGLRRDLEADLGVRAGVRQYIRVLQLLARHPLDQLERAVRLVRIRGDPTAVKITACVERLARQPPASSDSPLSLTPSALPDLSRFNRLLTSHPTPEESDEVFV